MKRTVRYEITVGLFVIVAAVIFGYISLKISRLRVRDGIEVGFLLPHACGLVKDAPVAVSGVEIGYVESLRLESDKALVTARLSSSAGLRKNIRATVRSKSLLGEKYLEVIPAGENAPLLESGDLITNTASPVQIDQVISWIGGLLERIDSQKAAQLLAALDRDPAALRRIIQNMDELLAKLASLDADQLKEFVEQLSVRARLF
jgi:phospholipid/cholesterol/gamma-HCH transport system substrate-binding protein